MSGTWQRVAAIPKSRIRVCQSRKSSAPHAGSGARGNVEPTGIGRRQQLPITDSVHYTSHTFWSGWLRWKWWWRWWQGWCWWWRWPQNCPSITHQAWGLCQCGWWWQRALFKLVFKRFAQRCQTQNKNLYQPEIPNGNNSGCPMLHLHHQVSLWSARKFLPRVQHRGNLIRKHFPSRAMQNIVSISATLCTNSK